MYDPIGMERKVKSVQREIARLDSADFRTMCPTVLMYANQAAEELLSLLATLERYYSHNRSGSS
jgi:hypothetical protein